MRLIDADALPKGKHHRGRLEWEDIAEVPTIDPVRHGYWKETDDPTFRACSVCGYLEYDCLVNNYCPECGSRMDARMDGGEE